MLVLDCTEATKSIANVERVCTKARECDINRQGVLIAVGGGVVSDITTVAASWIRRGIEHINIPTTLVGQIDAGIGIKGAVNFEGKKNYLGCFYPPSSVLIDPTFLNTLPARHFRYGYAEMVKMAIIRDGRLFNLLEEHGPNLIDTCFQEEGDLVSEVIWRSIEGMLTELEPNFFEDKSLERLVDFGHSFSPNLEAIVGFNITHGEAVAIDIAISTMIAHQLELIDDTVRDRIINVILRAGLDVWVPEVTPELCWAGMQDTALHRGDTSNLVVPTGIGGATFVQQEDVARCDLEAALAWLKAKNSQPQELIVTSAGGGFMIPPAWAASESLFR
jgi:2-epi-5-epi-valiolone synthase